MKRLVFSIIALLAASSAIFAGQQSKSDESLEFRPHWRLNVQGGLSYTLGEASFGKLLSPSALISAQYDFHPAMGVRVGFSGWQGKGSVVVTDEVYRFHYLQLNADYVLDLATLFDGFKHDRIWTPYVFAGIGGAYGFNNKEAGKYVAEYGGILSKYWESTALFSLRAGAGADFWLTENLALGIEANTNVYGDKFNSKGAIGKFNPDFQFNALLGVKYRFGGNNRPSVAYASAMEAAAAAAAAERIAAEKVASEKVAAEKAAAEKAAAEKAAAEAAEKAAAEKAAAEKAAAERAALAKENTVSIFFKFDSAAVTATENVKLEKLVRFMNENPDFTVLLVGYADKLTGSAEVNMRTAGRRAESVKKSLLQLGLAENRISIQVKGSSEQPYAENAKNRVVICNVR